MEWFSIVPALLASLVVLFLPGTIVALLIGLRGLWLGALAPVISITLLVVASIVMPYLGFVWNPLSALALVALSGALVVVLFRFLLKVRFDSGSDEASEDGRSAAWVTPLAWAIGAIMVTILIVAGVGAPDAISQTYDNIFHLNLVAQTLETGNASALVAGRLSAPTAVLAFYPNAWHVLVASVQMLSGVSIPVAINAFNIAAAATIWPAGMLLLSRLLVGRGTVAALATGVLLAAMPALPLNPLFFGVLYPFFLGMLLVPTVLSLVIQLIGLGHGSRIMSRLGVAVLLLGSLPAITFAHPSAMMAALALSLPAVAVVTFHGWRSFSSRRRRGRVIAFGVFLVFGLGMLVTVRSGSHWLSQLSVFEGLWQTVSLSLLGYGLPLVLAAIVIAGLMIGLRRGTREDFALIGIWATGAALFFISASIDFRPVRSLLVGVWYSDMPRLAAIFAIAVIPLAVRGIVGLGELKGASKLFGPQWIAATLLVLFAGVQLTAGWPQFLNGMRKAYTISASSVLLSSDEIRLIERLPELVPEGSVIAGNPWTGAGLAYAFAGRGVLMPHVGTSLSGNASMVMDQLRWADQNPEVCGAIKAEKVGFVLDFGRLEVHGDRHIYPGIENLAGSSAVELVAQEGDAKLYRVVACGLG